MEQMDILSFYFGKKDFVTGKNTLQHFSLDLIHPGHGKLQKVKEQKLLDFIW